jgi:hypothetical protein
VFGDGSHAAAKWTPDGTASGRHVGGGSTPPPPCNSRGRHESGQWLTHRCDVRSSLRTHVVTMPIQVGCVDLRVHYTYGGRPPCCACAHGSELTLPRVGRAAFCFGGGGANGRREPRGQAYCKLMLKPGDSDLRGQVVHLTRSRLCCPRTPLVRSGRGAVEGTLTVLVFESRISAPRSSFGRIACRPKLLQIRRCRIDALDVRTRLPSQSRCSLHRHVHRH